MLRNIITYLKSIIFSKKNNNSNVLNEHKDEIKNKHKVAIVENSKNVHIDQSTKIYRELEFYEKWRLWKGAYSGVYEKYFSNDVLEGYINTIIDLLVSDSNATIRVIGFAGLGKTRLIHECIKRLPSIHDKIIYCNASIQENNIPKLFVQLRKKEENKIVVVDNCDLQLHSRLISEIRNSTKIQLITIYHEPTERSNIRTILLEPNDFQSILPQMLNHFYPQMSKPDIDKISRFAQGFPSIAVQMSEARMDGNDNIGELQDDDLLRRIVGQDGFADDDTMKVLRVSSIFSEFGYYQNLKNQKEYIAITLSRLRGLNEVKIAQFEDICIKYMQRGLIERRGRYLFIRPKPLAVRLAGEWWRGFIDREADAVKLIEEIFEYGLDESLCKQMTMLDFLPEARRLTEELCGVQAPFGRTEVINTAGGSRLFRSFAEVNPEVITNTLFHHYANADKTILQDVTNGRRNLVWALEKLCFRKETFIKATKVLMAFAYGENENLANNATSQFTQLFQVHLSATEVDLYERYKIIEYGLSHDKLEYQELTLGAISKSLSYFGNSIVMRGAEQQGTKAVLQDYRPKTRDEVQLYYQKLIKHLLDFACSNNKLKNQAKAIVENNIRNVYANGFGQLIHDVLIQIHEYYDKVFWKEGYERVLSTYRYDKHRLRKRDNDELISLMKMLAPKTFEEKYEVLVKTHIGVFISENGTWNIADMSSSYETIQSNLKYYINEHIDDLGSWNYSIFYTDNPYNGHVFGKILADKISSNDDLVTLFLDKSLDAIKLIDNDKPNLVILGGFLHYLNKEEISLSVLKRLSKILDYEVIIPFATHLRLSVNNLLSLLEESQKNNTSIQAFRIFSYGQVLEHLGFTSILIFCKKLAEHGQQGIWTALQLLVTSVGKDDGRMLKSKELAKDLITREDIISDIQKTNGTWIFSLRLYIEKLLEVEDDCQLISYITKESIKHVKNSLGSGGDFIEKLFQLLIDKYFDISWKLIGEEILKSDIFFHKMKFLIGADDSPYGNQGTLFFNENNYPELLDWCKSNIPNAPLRIACIMPTSSNNKDSETKWHPFAKSMLDTFGQDESFLNQVSINISLFGSIGSRVPYIEQRIRLFELLLNHKFEEVRIWSKNCIVNMKNEVKNEKTFDEERDLF